MNSYGLYMDFIGMMKNFIKVNRGKHSFLCLDLQDFVEWIESCKRETQINFIEYAMKNWNAYSMDVINGNYNYINYTENVWSSYLKEGDAYTSTQS